VRGLGLMIGIELVTDRAEKTPDAALAGAVQDRMLNRGFLIGVGGYHGNVLRLQPPLVIADADLDRAIDALADSLDAV
jgi:4-aminobutyrate aminotransferase-like enzyme